MVRLNYSPRLGLDLGGSFHLGAYDDAGEETLRIFALDGSWNRGPIDVKAEFAHASISESVANSRFGYYAQVGYHLFPALLSQFPNSTTTASFHYDFIDLDTSDETRYTFGFNFRPEEATVLKLDYEIWDVAEKNSGIVFSVASYF